MTRGTAVNILFGGRQGRPGVKGDQGLPGPIGPGFRAKGVFVSGDEYGPGDAVQAEASSIAGVQSLYIQRSQVPLSPAVAAPRNEQFRWIEIGVFDLANFTGAVWRVTQIAHGFTGVGQPVAFSPVVERWVQASNKIGEQPAVAVVREIISADEVLLQGSGEISNLDPGIIFPQPVSEFEPGRFYYVSSVNGRLTLEPTAPSPGFASNAMLVATGATSGVVLQWQQTPNIVGRRPVGYDRFFYDATDGQTVFTGPDLEDEVLFAEFPDEVKVFVDGVLLSVLGDYTVPDEDTVVLAAGASAGARVEIWVPAEPLTATAAASGQLVDNITGLFDGAETVFPLTIFGGDPVGLAAAQSVLVVLDGNIAEPFTDYEIIPGSGTLAAIRFAAPPPPGMRFWAVIGTALSRTFGGDLTLSSLTLLGPFAAPTINVDVVRAQEVRGPSGGGPVTLTDAVIDEGTF